MQHLCIHYYRITMLDLIVISKISSERFNKLNKLFVFLSVQKASLPLLLNGKDVFIKSPTGTGKYNFCIPHPVQPQMIVLIKGRWMPDSIGSKDVLFLYELVQTRRWMFIMESLLYTVYQLVGRILFHMFNSIHSRQNLGICHPCCTISSSYTSKNPGRIVHFSLNPSLD